MTASYKLEVTVSDDDNNELSEDSDCLANVIEAHIESLLDEWAETPDSDHRDWYDDNA